MWTDLPLTLSMALLCPLQHWGDCCGSTCAFLFERLLAAFVNFSVSVRSSGRSRAGSDASGAESMLDANWSQLTLAVDSV